MLRKLFRNTRPLDLERELAALEQARAGLAPDDDLEHRAIELLIRSRGRMRRRLGARLPASRVA